MEEIKREILSLSEKYSVKCVESAALEERLAATAAQLAHAHQHIMQLDARYNSPHDTDTSTLGTVHHDPSAITTYLLSATNNFELTSCRRRIMS